MITVSDEENGNVLFLILIAVALFAALSYAVSKSSRIGAPNLREKDTLNVARILDFTSQVRVAVQRLKVMNGGAITDLLFNNDIYTRADGTTFLFNAMGNPADQRRYVFNARGGGIAPQTFEDLAAPCSSCSPSNTKPGHVALVWINIPGVGTDTSDPALFLPSLNKGSCSAIDKKLGLAGIPTLAVVVHATFAGVTSPPVVTASLGPGMAAVTGKHEFAIRKMPAPPATSLYQSSSKTRADGKRHAARLPLFAAATSLREDRPPSPRHQSSVHSTPA